MRSSGHMCQCGQKTGAMVCIHDDSWVWPASSSAHPRSHSLILPVVCCGLSLTILSFWLPEAVSFPFHSSFSCPNPGLMYDFSNPVIQLAQQASSVDLENQVPFSWWKLLFGNSFHHWHCSFPFSSLCSWCKHSTEDCASSFSQALVLLWECYWLW